MATDNDEPATSHGGVFRDASHAGTRAAFARALERVRRRSHSGDVAIPFLDLAVDRHLLLDLLADSLGRHILAGMMLRPDDDAVVSNIVVHLEADAIARDPRRHVAQKAEALLTVVCHITAAMEGASSLGVHGGEACGSERLEYVARRLQPTIEQVAALRLEFEECTLALSPLQADQLTTGLIGFAVEAIQRRATHADAHVDLATAIVADAVVIEVVCTGLVASSASQGSEDSRGPPSGVTPFGLGIDLTWARRCTERAGGSLSVSVEEHGRAIRAVIPRRDRDTRPNHI